MRHINKKQTTGLVTFWIILLVVFLIPLFGAGSTVYAQNLTKPTYTVKPESTPYQGLYKNFSTYNSKTRQYYLLRSYLEKFELVGGGTLILSKGTYVITNTLYVPSNVTIILKDGVKLVKGSTTGISKMTASKSLFQLISPSKASKAGVVSGYLGETGIIIEGEGTAVFDLNFVKDSIGIVFGHNTDVLISGITFRNMRGGHFIEMDASQNVIIENNSFSYHQSSDTGIKEAINIDTPDKNTGGFHEVWTNYDCTPDKDIIIQNNQFYDLERAIGTHKYSEGKYHENIQILNNKIEKTTSDAIRIMNWTTPTIKGNIIKMVAGGTGNNRAILASGVSHPIITENTFIDIPRAIQIMPWKNTDTGSQYAITYNNINSADIDSMLKNYLIRPQEGFIRVNYIYNVYDSNTGKYYFTGDYIRSRE